MAGAPGLTRLRPLVSEGRFALSTERLTLRFAGVDDGAARLSLTPAGEIQARAPDQQLRPDWLRLDVLLGAQRIGDVGLLFQDDAPTELGYRIEPEHRRRGYAVEALRALVALAAGPFAEAELAAEVAEDNMPSRRTLLALGFTESGSAGQRWSERRRAYIDYRRYTLACAI